MTDDENLIIPDGYTIGPISEHYGTFKVFQGDKQIGRIGWHSDYYTRFNAGESEVSVTGYIEGDSAHAKQKGLNALAAFHKVVGNLQLDYGVSFTPNVFMNTFKMASYDVSPIFEKIHFANVQWKADGWHVEQLYGELGTIVYPSAQEAAQAAIESAKAKGKTVLCISGEMIKAGWATDRSNANRLVGYGWNANKVQVNNDERTTNVDTKVNPGDVIKWNEKTWTVK